MLQAAHTEAVKLQPAWQTLSAALWAQQTLTWVLQPTQLMWVLQSPHTEAVKLQGPGQALSAALWAQQALTWMLQPPGQTVPGGQFTTTLPPGHAKGPWGLVGKSLTERFLKRNSAISMPSYKTVWRPQCRRFSAAVQGTLGMSQLTASRRTVMMPP